VTINILALLIAKFKIMSYKQFILLLKFAAISGNVLFILWISYNAIDNGFKGTPAEIVSAIGLIGLLSLNSILLLKKTQIS